MTTLFINLLNRSITAGWIVLAVMILRILLRKMPKRFTCMLWALVGVRLLLPFSVESIFSLIPSAKTLPESFCSGSLEIDSGITRVDRVINPAVKATFSRLSTGMSGAEALNIMMHCSVVIWLVGMCAMFTYLLVSYVGLQKKLSTAVLLRDNIRQSEYVDSPFIFGLIKPQIYVPFHMNDEVLSHVIAHENAHLARKDHLVKASSFCLLAVYWFHPLLWAAYILLCRDIELACDEKVIQNYSSEQRKSYLFSLIGYERKEISRGIPGLSCPLAFGELDMKERIRRAKTWKKPAFILVLLTAILCITAALCLLTNPPGTSRKPYETATPGSPQAMYDWRTKYIGDNSAVGNIIYNLTFPEDMTYQQFALQTSTKPYEVTITFALSEADKEAYDAEAPDRQQELALCQKNACILFSLIENAGIVNFKLVDETDEAKRPLTLVYTRQWAEYETDCSLWEESSSVESFEVLLLKLEELFGGNR